MKRSSATDKNYVKNNVISAHNNDNYSRVVQIETDQWSDKYWPKYAL